MLSWREKKRRRRRRRRKERKRYPKRWRCWVRMLTHLVPTKRSPCSAVTGRCAARFGRVFGLQRNHLIGGPLGIDTWQRTRLQHDRRRHIQAEKIHRDGWHRGHHQPILRKRRVRRRVI